MCVYRFAIRKPALLHIQDDYNFADVDGFLLAR